MLNTLNIPASPLLSQGDWDAAMAGVWMSVTKLNIPLLVSAVQTKCSTVFVELLGVHMQ